MASDPATGLPTAPTRTERLSAFGVDACMRAWELELMVEDMNLYSKPARADAPAGAPLHLDRVTMEHGPC